MSERGSCGSTCPLSIALALLVIATSSLTTADAQQSQVQRGEYLASAGDCLACHTAKGGAPYAGGNRLETPFGYMLASNITPDAETGIGRWTADDFFRALHEGVNKQGQDMYPTMPYDFYTKFAREDVDAIYAYLKTVKAVKHPIDVNHLRFPYNQRWSMAVWRELYFSEGTYKPDTAKSATWNRGAFLVEGPGHCSDCHSPRSALGGIERGTEFTGAMNEGWFALDLTSDFSTGLGNWTVEDIATYLKSGQYKGRPSAFGPMYDLVLSSTSRLTDLDRKAMGEYLKSLPARPRVRAAVAAVDPATHRGATLYLDNCIRCHMAKGRGLPGAVPALAGNGAVLAPDPADVIYAVLGGMRLQGRYHFPMPSYAANLNDLQVAEVVNYLRTSWGNQAPANATAEQVSKLRISIKK
jgi:mono/diheme cytochrome c family protein